MQLAKSRLIAVLQDKGLISSKNKLQEDEKKEGENLQIKKRLKNISTIIMFEHYFNSDLNK